MFDRYSSYEKIEKQPFTFYPTRYEIWMGRGQMTGSGRTNSPIKASVVNLDGSEKVEITFSDLSLIDELAQSNFFDEFVTSFDRLQLFTVPSKTDSTCMGINALLLVVGPTRHRKNFKRNEPYCCNLFTINGSIVKIAFSFSNPEKMIEFYSENL